MKRIASIALALGIMFAPFAITGCATNTVTGQQLTASQQFDQVAGAALGAVDQIAITATTGINANLLKGADADRTIAAITTARDAIKLTRSLVAVATLTPGQGQTQIAASLAALGVITAFLESHGIATATTSTK